MSAPSALTRSAICSAERYVTICSIVSTLLTRATPAGDRAERDDEREPRERRGLAARSAERAAAIVLGRRRRGRDTDRPVADRARRALRGAAALVEAVAVGRIAPVG